MKLGGQAYLKVPPPASFSLFLWAAVKAEWAESTPLVPEARVCLTTGTEPAMDYREMWEKRNISLV